MIRFKTEVNQRKLAIQPQIDEVRKEVFDNWWKYLCVDDFGPYELKASQLSEFQVAFLTIFDEKYEKDIYPILHKKIDKHFFYYYDEDKDAYEIGLHGIDISNVELGDWTLTFEDGDSSGSIVHIDFHNWKCVFSSLSS